MNKAIIGNFFNIGYRFESYEDLTQAGMFSSLALNKTSFESMLKTVDINFVIDMTA